jgi:hypothetical protein
VRLGTLNSPDQPCCSKRSFRDRVHSPAHFLRRPIALDVVAGKTTGHQVLPLVFPAARARHNVINGGGRPATVSASVGVSAQYPPARNRNMAIVRHLDISGEDDYGGSLPRTIHTSHRVALITFDHYRSTVHHQHERSAKRHHGQWLISRVQHQRPARSPLGGHYFSDATHAQAPLTQKTPSKIDGVEEYRDVGHPTEGRMANNIRK